MAKTPEGEIKKLINAALVGDDVYSFMPVQQGFGKAGLDYHCTLTVRNTCLAFFIEAKKPKAVAPTERQSKLILEHRKRKAKVFVIYTWAGVKELEQWLASMRALN